MVTLAATSVSYSRATISAASRNHDRRSGGIGPEHSDHARPTAAVPELGPPPATLPETPPTHRSCVLRKARDSGKPFAHTTGVERWLKFQPGSSIPGIAGLEAGLPRPAAHCHRRRSDSFRKRWLRVWATAFAHVLRRRPPHTAWPKSRRTPAAPERRSAATTQCLPRCRIFPPGPRPRARPHPRARYQMGCLLVAGSACHPALDQAIFLSLDFGGMLRAISASFRNLCRKSCSSWEAEQAGWESMLLSASGRASGGEIRRERLRLRPCTIWHALGWTGGAIYAACSCPAQG